MFNPLLWKMHHDSLAVLMRQNVLIKALAVSVIVQICSCVGAINGGKFEFPRKGYEVDLMNDQWVHEINYQRDPWDIRFKNINEDATILVLTFRLSDEDKPKTDETFAARLALWFKRSGYIDEIKTQKIQMNGRPAIENLYSGIYKGKDLIIKGDTYWYVLRYIAPTLSYDKYLPDYEKFVQSFHLDMEQP